MYKAIANILFIIEAAIRYFLADSNFNNKTLSCVVVRDLLGLETVEP